MAWYNVNKLLNESDLGNLKLLDRESDINVFLTARKTKEKVKYRLFINKIYERKKYDSGRLSFSSFIYSKKIECLDDHTFGQS